MNVKARSTKYRRDEIEKVSPVYFRSHLKELLNEADTAPVVKIIVRRGVLYRAELRRLKT